MCKTHTYTHTQSLTKNESHFKATVAPSVGFVHSSKTSLDPYFLSLWPIYSTGNRFIPQTAIHDSGRSVGVHTICRFSLIWWDYVKMHGCVDVSHTFSMRKWVLAFILSFFVCMFDSKYIIAPICRLSKRLARLRGTRVVKCFGKLCLNWGDSTALKSIRHRNWIYRARINDCFEGFRKVFWC